MVQRDFLLLYNACDSLVQLAMPLYCTQQSIKKLKRTEWSSRYISIVRRIKAECPEEVCTNTPMY